MEAVLDRRLLVCGVLVVGGAFACEKTEKPSDPMAGIGISGDKQKALDVINPAKAKPNAGPVGAIAGVITMKGDLAPAPKEPSGLVDPKCRGGVPFYQSLFREGPGRTVADVLVAVTGYKGFVPAREPAVTVSIDDLCRFNSRTIALTFGQQLSVRNGGPRPFTPQLKGASAAALLVATSGGEAVPLYPTEPGRYAIQDAAFDHMRADVYVLKYSTFAVTGPDGKYSIGRIPPGEVTISAYLPSILATVQKKLVVQEGETLELNLEIPFDAKKHASLRKELEAAFQERVDERHARDIMEGRAPVPTAEPSAPPATGPSAPPAASASD